MYHTFFGAHNLCAIAVRTIKHCSIVLKPELVKEQSHHFTNNKHVDLTVYSLLRSSKIQRNCQCKIEKKNVN